MLVTYWMKNSRLLITLHITPWVDAKMWIHHVSDVPFGTISSACLASGKSEPKHVVLDAAVELSAHTQKSTTITTILSILSVIIVQALQNYVHIIICVYVFLKA